MTVQELKEKLDKYSQDSIVVTQTLDGMCRELIIEGEGLAWLYVDGQGDQAKTYKTLVLK